MTQETRLLAANTMAALSFVNVVLSMFLDSYNPWPLFALITAWLVYFFATWK